MVTLESFGPFIFIVVWALGNLLGIILLANESDTRHMTLSKLAGVLSLILAWVSLAISLILYIQRY